MLNGHARVSRADGTQLLELRRDALVGSGVAEGRVYEDRTSGRHDHRPGLEACLNLLQRGNTFVVWKFDRLGRNLKRLVTTVDELPRPRCGGCARWRWRRDRHHDRQRSSARAR